MNEIADLASTVFSLLWGDEAQRVAFLGRARKELDGLRQKVRQLELLVAALEAPSSRTGDEPPPKPRESPADTAAPRMSVRQAIVEALESAGKPLRIKQLLPKVEQLRGPIKAKNPKSAIWSTVSQEKQELKSQNGLIGLAKWEDSLWPQFTGKAKRVAG
jgi:hypothetical protein